MKIINYIIIFILLTNNSLNVFSLSLKNKKAKDDCFNWTLEDFTKAANDNRTPRPKGVTIFNQGQWYAIDKDGARKLVCNFEEMKAAYQAQKNAGNACVTWTKKDFSNTSAHPMQMALGATKETMVSATENYKPICNINELREEYIKELKALNDATTFGEETFCWKASGSCPNKWTRCGLGCAKNNWECFNSVFKKIYEVGNMVSSIVMFLTSFGTANALKAAIKTGAMNAKKATLEIAKLATNIGKNGFKPIVNVMVSNGKKVAKKLGETLVDNVTDPVNVIDKSLNPGLDWSDLTSLDPTGISGLIMAFWHTLCDNLKPDTKKKI